MTDGAQSKKWPADKSTLVVLIGRVLFISFTMILSACVYPARQIKKSVSAPQCEMVNHSDVLADLGIWQYIYRDFNRLVLMPKENNYQDSQPEHSSNDEVVDEMYAHACQICGSSGVHSMKIATVENALGAMIPQLQLTCNKPLSVNERIVLFGLHGLTVTAQDSYAVTSRIKISWPTWSTEVNEAERAVLLGYLGRKILPLCGQVKDLVRINFGYEQMELKRTAIRSVNKLYHEVTLHCKQPLRKILLDAMVKEHVLKADHEYIDGVHSVD
ncbi:hypothetical protein [Marinicella meishanensis]|uniref:hypothetical protein n=1 Tax=Marinicella meishanensis TaxID=2873263 RepID=UPI001CBE533E|nr:hypothetical protein [Marinicella sp. NBU2979]